MPELEPELPAVEAYLRGNGSLEAAARELLDQAAFNGLFFSVALDECASAEERSRAIALEERFNALAEARPRRPSTGST